MKVIKIDCRKIKDWDSFHDVFAKACGFPKSYGRNLDAWIDCMGDLKEDMSIIQLNYVESMARRCPEIFQAINDCTAFVNFREIEQGHPVRLAVAYQKDN